MWLSRLSATGVRNLQPVAISPSPRINIFYGANGSGKTSLLEAIHFLGLARSFRAGRLDTLIQHHQPYCQVFGRVQTQSSGSVEPLVFSSSSNSLGIQRDRQAELQIRIDGQRVRAISALAEKMPFQLIHPGSFQLLEGAPKLRRQFLDWGVFHADGCFITAWQSFQHALQQRNSWLRHGTLDPLLQQTWDQAFAASSEALDHARQQYIRALKPVFEEKLAQLTDIQGLVLSYYRGWDKDRSLAEVLNSTLHRDRLLGHTQAGPQRADIRVRLGSNNAVDVLSRGQQKLVISALKIAQGYLLSNLKQRHCMYLVDDLSSELDPTHLQAVCRLLEQLNCQVFITCIDPQPLSRLWHPETPISMFHVEHGHLHIKP